jgi:tetratricopeptide (TPR) repeat protein
MKTRFVIFIFLWGFFAFPLISSGSESWWDESFSCRRKFVVEQDSFKSARTDTAVASFYTYGRLENSARDIRVLDSRANPVPFQVMFFHPDLYCIVAFRHSPGEKNYWIYHGNKNAKKLDFTWMPKAGLLLTTYKREGDIAPNWTAMRRAFRNGPPHPFGAGYRDLIFDGLNPYGSSVDFISRYLAYFFADREGEYRFCTASDDASFLLVDEKLVADWPGWHDAGGGVYGQHYGTIELKKGIHKLTYYHLQGGDQTACVAGWQKPGDRHVSLMPPDAFVPVLRTNCLLFEIRGQTVAPDFKAEQLDTLATEGKTYVLFQFTDITPSAVPELVQRRWDFGDGISTLETNPTHLYLSEGIKTVKLVYQMKNGEVVTSEQSLPVYGNPPLTNPDPFYLQTMIAGWAVQYPLESLSREDLASAALLLVNESRYEPVFKVLESRFKNMKDVDDPLENELALLYGRILTEHKNDFKGATAFLIKWLEKGKTGKRTVAQKAPIYFYLARLQSDQLKNPGDSLKSLSSLLNADDELNRQDQKKLYQELGDLYLSLKDLKRARDFYNQVEVLVTGDLRQPASFYKSSCVLTVESYIRSGNLTGAEDALLKWQEDFPTEKINGHSLLLYGKLYRAKKEYESSNKILETLMENDPSSNLVREALVVQGSNYIALQDYAKASAIFRRLLNQYDDAESRDELKAKLDYCEKTLQQSQPLPAK